MSKFTVKMEGQIKRLFDLKKNFEAVVGELKSNELLTDVQVGVLDEIDLRIVSAVGVEVHRLSGEAANG